MQVVLYQLFKYKNFSLILFVFILISCASTQFRHTQKAINTHFGQARFAHQHTGLLMVDLGSQDTLFKRNTQKFFIPASTTKLFTLYTSLQLIKAKIPALKYKVSGKKVTVLPTGDPTWLHPYFKDSTALHFLNGFDSIALHLDHYKGQPFGPGWSWEDYPYYYSAEVSPLPLYGNVVLVKNGDTPSITPAYFADSLVWKNHAMARSWKQNKFFIAPALQDSLSIPFITSKKLTAALMGNLLQGKLVAPSPEPNSKWKTLAGVAVDSVLKRMLWKSDNFLAEQLMLMAAANIADTLSFTTAKEAMLANQLKDLSPTPRWVDGSGLSRYNLFTPTSMVSLLTKLHQEIDHNRLFALMPYWQANGTLTHKPSDQAINYIRAKSGSMGNVYNLCGFLFCRSGKTVAFSYMNNHFRRPSKTVRQDIESLLKQVYEQY